MFQRKRNRKTGQAGVTLIEMLVVVTIIGLFVALVGPSSGSTATRPESPRRAPRSTTS
jgi:prepilin-type N-terminal cleavage/methylation domain-containing protein